MLISVKQSFTKILQGGIVFEKYLGTLKNMKKVTGGS